MNMYNDYLKFNKSKKINQTYQNKYFQNNAQYLDDTSSFFPQDVFQKLLKDRIIILSGDIDTYQCEFIKANLLYLESIDDSDITLYINSPGGSVYDGLGLLDVMEFIKPDIQTINTGLAASMAAIILCCGKKGKRKSLKRSRVMIHQPMTGFNDYIQASDLEIEAKQINSLKKELYDIISNKTGQKFDKVHADGDRDYWMDAKAAKDYGMIDEILKKRK